MRTPHRSMQSNEQVVWMYTVVCNWYISRGFRSERNPCCDDAERTRPRLGRNGAFQLIVNIGYSSFGKQKSAPKSGCLVSWRPCVLFSAKDPARSQGRVFSWAPKRALLPAQTCSISRACTRINSTYYLARISGRVSVSVCVISHTR